MCNSGGSHKAPLDFNSVCAMCPGASTFSPSNAMKIQMKYRRCSILKKPRIEQVTKKKRRKRRDYTEIRKKTASKHNKVWKKLLEFDPKKERERAHSAAAVAKALCG